jgi:hypothetical protein
MEDQTIVVTALITDKYRLRGIVGGFLLRLAAKILRAEVQQDLPEVSDG